MAKKILPYMDPTVDGWNPAPVEGTVVYPIIYVRFIHPNGGWEWDIWTINSSTKNAFLKPPGCFRCWSKHIFCQTLRPRGRFSMASRVVSIVNRVNSWFPWWVGSVAYNNPLGKDYKWYIHGICQLSDYISPTYHLLREPETAIDIGKFFNFSLAVDFI